MMEHDKDQRTGLDQPTPDAGSEPAAPPRRRFRRVRVLVLRPLATLLLVGLAFGGWRYLSGNQGVIVPGQVYRSGQLSARGLKSVIQARGIRTVLNLRGCNPDQPWYRAERATTLGAGAVQLDMPLASDHWLTRAQAKTLVEVLDDCPKPMLIHCQWGAERTGLVATMVELMRPGGSPASARAQFSLYYLYLPTRDGRTMRALLDRYEAWLNAERLPHDPARFRRWIAETYRPGFPSREDWPFDPLPLVVASWPKSQ